MIYSDFLKALKLCSFIKTSNTFTERIKIVNHLLKKMWNTNRLQVKKQHQMIVLLANLKQVNRKIPKTKNRKLQLRWKLLVIHLGVCPKYDPYIESSIWIYHQRSVIVLLLRKSGRSQELVMYSMTFCNGSVCPP